MTSSESAAFPGVYYMLHFVINLKHVVGRLWFILMAPSDVNTLFMRWRRARRLAYVTWCHPKTGEKQYESQ